MPRPDNMSPLEYANSEDWILDRAEEITSSLELMHRHDNNKFQKIIREWWSSENISRKMLEVDGWMELLEDTGRLIAYKYHKFDNFQ